MDFVQLLRGTWVDTGICPSDGATSLDMNLLTGSILRAEGLETDIMDTV
jgi:hypothetical protein